MTPEDKIKYVKATLDTLNSEVKVQWSKNYIAMRVNENIANDENNDQKKRDTAAKEVEACKANMKVAEQQIANFDWLLTQEK